MSRQTWDKAEKRQELFAFSVAMDTFICNIAKRFIIQHFSIDVNDSPYNRPYSASDYTQLFLMNNLVEVKDCKPHSLTWACI